MAMCKKKKQHFRDTAEDNPHLLIKSLTFELLFGPDCDAGAGRW